MARADATEALFAAATEGDLPAARRALRDRADLEARNHDRQTPLIVATKARQTKVALLLLEAGADPDAKDALQDSAFLYAGAEGYDEILRATLRHGANVKSTNRFGGTALIPASEHGHTTTVRILINAGVPLDHVNDLGWTAMLEAIVLNDGSADQVDVVRQLIGAGADTSIRDKDGRTPRSLAAARGYDEIVDLIDDAQEIRDRGRRLITAARAGDDDLVEKLLDQHASIAARDRTQATALIAAAYGNHLAIVDRLLRVGADPNAKDETVQSAYLIATSEVGDDPRLLRATLKHGADVHSLDSWKGTGLIRAADRGFDKIIDVLLQTDVDIDHVNRIGYTALHEAVILGDGGPSHQRTVAALVAGGVDRSIEDPNGDTALDVARARGYTRIVDLLS
jgi:ankyrin repeat protein